jgi:hypothetical protein
MNQAKTNPSKDQPANSSPDLSKIKGEGDYESARRYNESTKQFVADDKVSDAVKNAAPHSEQEAKELEAAERKGLERSKGEDPSVKRR